MEGCTSPGPSRQAKRHKITASCPPYLSLPPPPSGKKNHRPGQQQGGGGGLCWPTGLPICQIMPWGCEDKGETLTVWECV